MPLDFLIHLQTHASSQKDFEVNSVINWQLVKIFKDGNNVGVIKYSICKLVCMQAAFHQNREQGYSYKNGTKTNNCYLIVLSIKVIQLVKISFQQPSDTYLGSH